MATNRTWVSGVGDDANPCSRTAPCKTFAGAISKTFPGGEISVLDPGGFGAVTITKSVTLNGDGTLASIFVGGTNAFNISAGAGDTVILRNLKIFGGDSGLVGVKLNSAGAVHIENCHIYSFTSHGIDMSPAAGTLFVKDTNIKKCGGNGINVTSAGIVRAAIEDVRMDQCSVGCRAGSGARVTLRNCHMSGNGTGFKAEQTAADNPIATLERCRMSENATAGVQAGPGSPVVHLSQCYVVNNGANGLSVSGGGQILSYGNNVVVTNATDGAVSGPDTFK